MVGTARLLSFTAPEDSLPTISSIFVPRADRPPLHATLSAADWRPDHQKQGLLLLQLRRPARCQRHSADRDRSVRQSWTRQSLIIDYCVDARFGTIHRARYRLKLSDLQQVQAYCWQESIRRSEQHWRTPSAKYPANDSSQGDGLNTGGFDSMPQRQSRLNSHIAKLDFNIDEKPNRIFAR